MKADRTRDRQRFVYDRIQPWQRGVRGRATTLAQGLPIEVRGQGLTSALALLAGKTGTEYQELADLLATWLLEDRRLLAAPIRGFDEKKGSRTGRLLSACLRADRATYLATQAEALALLDEVKVLSKALKDSPAQDSPARSKAHG